MGTVLSMRGGVVQGWRLSFGVVQGGYCLGCEEKGRTGWVLSWLGIVLGVREVLYRA